MRGEEIFTYVILLIGIVAIAGCSFFSGSAESPDHVSVFP